MKQIALTIPNGVFDNFRKLVLFRVRKGIYKIITTHDVKAVLDVGCGNGSLLSGLRSSEIRIWGTDISAASLANAKNRNLYAGLVLADASALPFSSGYFDAINIGFVLHELTERKRREVLNEIIRLTKEGGIIIITDFSQNNNTRAMGRIFGFLFKKEEEFIGKIYPAHYINYLDFIIRGGIIKILSEFRIGTMELKKIIYFCGNVSTVILKKNRYPTIGLREVVKMNFSANGCSVR